MIWLVLLSLAGLFLCSAFFSMSETALTSLSPLKMKRMVLANPGLQRILSLWLSHPQRLLITILVGNNIASMAISSLLASFLIPWAGFMPSGLAEVALWLFITGLLLVFGEIIPKIVGRVFAEPIMRWALPFLSGLGGFFSFFWRPVEKAMALLGAGGNLSPVNRLTEMSLEEMAHVIDEAAEKGDEVPRESAEMMQKVISLNHRLVSDIMVPAQDADAVNLDALEKKGKALLFIDLVAESGRSRVPVLREGRPIGVVHVMDLLRADPLARVSDLGPFIRPPFLVPLQKPVADLFGEMKKTGQHMALVEGPGGVFAGIVTLEDVLEEVVGDILDEYDLESQVL